MNTKPIDKLYGKFFYSPKHHQHLGGTRNRASINDQLHDYTSMFSDKSTLAECWAYLEKMPFRDTVYLGEGFFVSPYDLRATV